MEWLGLNHMHVYMVCLYDKIPADKMGKPFGFMNLVTAHWILVVIDVAAKTGYFMDPQGNSPAEHIKELVPKQPGSYECGYYVMLYMRDIIVDPSLLLNNAEMDEVRYERMNYVRVLI
ncbi:hypothetical protein CISIN_1g035622mg [Citrus sinensis]|uniref:Ubiquitin-like protease family profile domain-containing protein n=1 Tax=Citrus sinensis TaxID=2711 RepID=A0A067DBI9_CITSI|nr:hypothetical protein CISIN_1g035622mg [Citrus sinensis]